MAGRARGPLDGIPIAHKDIYCTKGLPTTAHSKLLQDYIPDTDARTVTMLDDAGTVMLGKLSTHEFAMAGHDPADPASANRPVPNFRSDLHKGAKGLRIGVIRNFHETDNPANPAVCAAIDDAIAFYKSEGAIISDVVLPSLEDYRAAGFLILITEAFAVHEPWLRTRYNDYGELLRDRLALGGLTSAADYIQATRRRRELCLQTAEAMEPVDLLLTTASPTEAPKIEGIPKWSSMEKPGYTMPFNLTGLPAISVCAGYGAAGLPLSIQLVGKAFQEQTIFRAAHAYETATAWRDRRPPMAS